MVVSLKTNQYSLYGRSVSLFGLIKEEKKEKIMSLFFVWSKRLEGFPCNQFSDDLEAIIRLKVR